ncbi:MAG TPA: 2-amino-4-hydroxy-6-hydroxymethyldihydropteridine diphosphokinase [Xanthobacteraceae bacterium]|nr:2-amino-4-hydroxy-6-hydroxymethyldihydropteridine diphosphokinase [Xanthobacteraceae bacterium]
MTKANSTEALIALGGNIGNAALTFERAVTMLCDEKSVWLRQRSANYRTPPWGVTDQAAFMNAAIAVTTTLSPRELLGRMREVEWHLGRNRAFERRWGPRTLDLDLLAYDDVTLDTPELTLPHPRMFERAFVLVPLAEIAPDRIISGVRVRDALARVDAAGVERLS